MLFPNLTISYQNIIVSLLFDNFRCIIFSKSFCFSVTKQPSHLWTVCVVNEFNIWTWVCLQSNWMKLTLHQPITVGLWTNCFTFSSWRENWVVGIQPLKPHPCTPHSVKEIQAQLAIFRKCLHDLTQPNCFCSRLAAVFETRVHHSSRSRHRNKSLFFCTSTCFTSLVFTVAGSRTCTSVTSPQSNFRTLPSPQ